MPSNTIPKTVLLRGDPIGSEAKGSGTITPGMLLALNSTGLAIPHGVAGGVAGALFAREEEYVGGALETAYASGDEIAYWNCRKGDRVYALLASGQNVAAGAQLESAGNGYLRAKTAFAQSGTTPFAVTPEGHAVARALEAVDASGGVTRIRVEIL